MPEFEIVKKNTAYWISVIIVIIITIPFLILVSAFMVGLSEFGEGPSPIPFVVGMAILYLIFVVIGLNQKKLICPSCKLKILWRKKSIGPIIGSSKIEEGKAKCPRCKKTFKVPQPEN